jgi:hypothetical protein
MAEQSGLSEPLYAGAGSRPVPDPTELTSLAVAQAMETMRRDLTAAVEVLEAKMDGRQNTIETRLNGMDTAITLVRDVTDKLPSRMDEKVKHLQELTDVKFNGIQVQFVERDVRTDQTARDAKTAVDAALQAQKEQAGKQADTFSEATLKSEQQFTKQIDQQGELLRTATKGLEDKINDLKDRFNRGEGVSVGQTTTRLESQSVTRDNYGLVFAVIGAAGLIAGIVIAIVK